MRVTRLVASASGAFLCLAPLRAHALKQLIDTPEQDGRVLQLGSLRATRGLFDIGADTAPRRERHACIRTPQAARYLSVEADGEWSYVQGDAPPKLIPATHLGDFRFVPVSSSTSPICMVFSKPKKGPWRARLRFFGANLSDLQTSPMPTPMPVAAPESASGAETKEPASPGVYRTHYRSVLDGRSRELALYLPKDIRSNAALPVIVALHGMNGSAMAYLRYVLGGFDETHDQAWHDADTFIPSANVSAIVVAPSAFGNAFYRGPGEEDVMEALAWVRAHYNVDSARISITGASMGGTGAASLAFRYPHVFSRVQALCGYHSYFARSDMPQTMAPWEHFLAAERSNTAWASNAYAMPLHLVQGTRDLPLSNGKTLVNRFNELGQNVRAEWPALAHNVWGYTYANLAGASWLLEPTPPSTLAPTFRTARMRYHDGIGLHVDARERHDAWADLSATWQDASHVAVRTQNASAFHVDPRGGEPLRVTVGGVTLQADAPGAMYLSKLDGRWLQSATAALPDGPFMDVYHTPITIVYGDALPALHDVSKRVAEHWARKPSFRRWNESEDMAAGSGWPTEPGVHYPVLSDTEFLARGTVLPRGASLFLVGSEPSNRVLAALGPMLPIRILSDKVQVGSKSFGTAESGAIFVYPRPDDPTGYIAVVGAPTALGLQRSLSAPDLLPDYMVYDQGLSAAATNIWLGDGQVQAAGFFDASWHVPSH